jgi:hypothetical protein
MSQSTRKALGSADIKQASANHQKTISGTSVSVSDASDTSRAYFITSIIGTGVTIADKDGTTVIVTGTVSFNFPLRIDGGFSIAASATAYVTYFDI